MNTTKLKPCSLQVGQKFYDYWDNQYRTIVKIRRCGEYFRVHVLITNADDEKHNYPKWVDAFNTKDCVFFYKYDAISNYPWD